MRAGWLNAINGKFFSLHWDKSKWLLEEMPDGSPMPASLGFTEATKFVSYELPILDRFVKKTELLYRVSLDAETVRMFAKFHSEDSGATVRHKLVEGTKHVLHEVLKGFEEDIGQYPQAEEKLAAYKKLLPDLERKLTWKKLR